MAETDPRNTMSDLLEAEIGTRVLAAIPALKVLYDGEPAIVPVDLHPFASVFVTDDAQEVREQTELGITTETGVRWFLFEGEVAFEVLVPDTSRLRPDANRRATVASYAAAKEYAHATKQALWAWAPLDVIPDEDAVVSADGREKSVLLLVGGITNGVQRRLGSDDVSNRSSIGFRVYTRRETW